MFAITENLNIFHKHHILRIFCTVLSKVFPEHIGNLLIGIAHSFKNFLIHFCDSLRCLFESLSIRIITKGLEDSPNMQPDGLCIDLSQIILRGFAHSPRLFLSHFLILHLVIRFLFLLYPALLRVPDDLVQLKLKLHIIEFFLYQKIYHFHRLYFTKYRAEINCGPLPQTIFLHDFNSPLHI